MDNEELLAYCEMLENIVMERGINADFMWKAKRAIEKLDEIRSLVEGVNSRSYCDVNWWNEYLEIEEVLNAE